MLKTDCFYNEFYFKACFGLTKQVNPTIAFEVVQYSIPCGYEYECLFRNSTVIRPVETLVPRTSGVGHFVVILQSRRT